MLAVTLKKGPSKSVFGGPFSIGGKLTSLSHHPELNSFQRKYVKENTGKDRTKLWMKILFPLFIIIPTIGMGLQIAGLELSPELNRLLFLALSVGVLVDFLGVLMLGGVVLFDGIFYLGAQNSEDDSEARIKLHEYMVDKLSLERTDFLQYAKVFFTNGYHVAFILCLAMSGWILYALLEVFLFGISKMLIYFFRLTTANYFLTFTPEKLKRTKVIQGGENGEYIDAEAN